ncbi:MAG: STY4528 family pathogenicity island replication protein [Pseudomonadota bacterium]
MDKVTPRTLALAVYIEETAERLMSGPDTKGPEAGLMFLGNWQDAVPRLLIYDPVLDAVEIRVWLIVRTLVQHGTMTAFPTYDQISAIAGVARASIAAALMILRITRWLTLCAKVRNRKGQYRGNIYALHDEPITLADALHLDPGYIVFLQNMRSHGNPRVSRMAEAVWATIKDEIDQGKDALSATTLSRIDARHAAQQAIETHNTPPGTATADIPATIPVDSFFSVNGIHRARLKDERDHQVQNLNLVSPDASSQVQNLNLAGENKNNKENQQDDIQVQNLNLGSSNFELGRSSCSSYIYKKTTTTTTDSYVKPPRERANLGTDLVFPSALPPQEQQLALIPLERIAPDTRQDVLDQLAWRIADGKASGNLVRNHLAYLAQLCNEVVAGTFVFSGGQRIREARERQRKEGAIEAKRKQEIAQEGQGMNRRLEQTDPRLAARIKGMQEKAKRGGAPCAT